MWERIIPRLNRHSIAVGNRSHNSEAADPNVGADHSAIDSTKHRVVATGILPSRDIRTSLCIGNRSHNSNNHDGRFKRARISFLPSAKIESRLILLMISRTSCFGPASPQDLLSARYRLAAWPTT